MNSNEIESVAGDYNRRDFIKGGSVATLMTMLGGVEVLGQAPAATPATDKPSGNKVKVGVIGLGTQGRELISLLGRFPLPKEMGYPVAQAQIVTICDTYASSMKRASSNIPGVKQEKDYQAVLADKGIDAVMIATPTHQHKEVVLAALKAGKHVYCEAPLATTIDDAKEIAKAAKAARHLVFQAGFQLRAEQERHFLVPFIRSGAIGTPLTARSQFHKKVSWRASASNPEREKELNWRLSKETSIGLIGEIGCHQIDQAMWFLNSKPTAVTGFGSVAFWKDGRDVPDTVQAVVEFPKGVLMNYEGTLGNSFDGTYDMFFGSDAAIMLRSDKAWMFKEVDSPLLGWEVYARKETFYKETGITLAANGSKSVPAGDKSLQGPDPNVNLALLNALAVFLHNVADVVESVENARATLGDDPEGLAEQAAGTKLIPASNYLQAFQSTVAAIKANEAIMAGKRIEIKPELYELT
jgi:predicted dehydrogenase